jgi:hypothetical protein
MPGVRITPSQIEDWVARNFKYKKRSNGRQLVINNPFCEDKGYHFWISTEERESKNGKVGYWVHDFRTSEYNTSFIGFVKRYKGVTFFEALADVCGQSKGSLRDALRRSRRSKEDDEEEEQIRHLELPEMSKPFRGTESKVRDLALRYLKSRCISEEIAMELYYTPTTIVFPYIEYGSLVYWQEREILRKKFNFPNEAKTGLAKTDYLYNFDNVEQPYGNVVIVESIFNCLSIGDGTVATGGAVIPGGSKQIMKLVALLPKLVVLAPDRDKAGIDSLLSNFLILRKALSCSFAYCLPPKGVKDWNQMDQVSGVGSARDYVANCSRTLDVKVIVSLRAQVQDLAS